MVLGDDAPRACHLVKPFALLNLQPTVAVLCFQEQTCTTGDVCNKMWDGLPWRAGEQCLLGRLRASRRHSLLEQLAKAISHTSRCLRSRYRVMSICIVQRDMQADPTQRNMPARRPANQVLVCRQASILPAWQQWEANLFWRRHWAA